MRHIPKDRAGSIYSIAFVSFSCLLCRFNTPAACDGELHFVNPAKGAFVMNSSIFVSPQKANPVEIIQIMDIFVIVFSVLAVLIAGIIRGYSGFGFSIIATTSMTLVLPPVDVIPVVLVLEILASAWLLPRVWKQIDWKSLSWLSAGVLIGTPPGVYLLAHVPARPMRAGIALSIMVLVVLLWRGRR